MTNLFRSLIFVPGNNPRFLEKAKSLSADIVCFDLEDSVPDKEKKKARTLIKNVLKQRNQYSASVFARTNSPDSNKIEADLKEIVQKGIDGIVIPKVNSAKEIKKIEKIISSLEKQRKIRGIRLILSIESALGVINCYEIASSSKRIDALVFGIFDLLNDVGIEYTKGNPRGAKYSRYKIPIVATAAGVFAIDGIKRIPLIFRFFSIDKMVFSIFLISFAEFTLGMIIPSIPFCTISFRSASILLESGEFVLTKTDAEY